MSQVAYQAGAYPGFCSMKLLGVFLLPLDGKLAHRRVTTSVMLEVCWYPFIHLGGEKHCESKVSCHGHEHNVMSLVRAQT